MPSDHISSFPPYGETDGQAGGVFTQRVQETLSGLLDGSGVLLTTSCTDALEMSAILADITPGDTVIVPAFGFVTTALAFVRQGAEVRFADIEEDTLGIDPKSVENLLDNSVRAIVPIHYAGVPCAIDRLVELASEAGVCVIEDNAHGLFGKKSGRPLGTFGQMSALSFHATKNLSCGEGGALVVNDDSLVSRAHVVLEKGTDRRAFTRGEADRYTWRDLGSSFGLSDFLASILEQQLRESNAEQNRRKQLVEEYDRVLSEVLDDVRTLKPSAHDTPAYHLYPVLLERSELRDDVVARLQSQGVRASSHYVPLHTTPAGRRFGTAPSGCPISEQVAASVVRLPLGSDVRVTDVPKIVSLLKNAIDQGDM